MTTETRDTLKHLMWPAITMAVVFIVKEMRRLSWGDDVGIRWVPWRTAALWSVLFAILFVIEEIAYRLLRKGSPEPWGKKYSGTIKAIRVFAMVVLAPLSEELVFRGLLYNMLSTTAIGPIGAIVVTAAVFALIHSQYRWRDLPFILVDGFFYGAVRYVTGSTLLAVLFHGLGNLYAAYERLAERRLI